MTCKLNADTSDGLKIVSDTSGEIDLQIDASTKVHMASDGKVGIGTNAPESGFHLTDGTNVIAPQNANRTATLIIEGGSETADLQFLTSQNYNHIFFGDAADANVGSIVYDHTNNSMQFSTNASEKMRIDTDGFIGVGITSIQAHLHVDSEDTGSTFGRAALAVTTGDPTVDSSNQLVVCAFTGDSDCTNGTFISFRDSGGEIGHITCNGTSSVQYSTSSDYRLKENVEYTFDATSRLKQLKPCRFNFKADTDKTVDGFLAHEVSSIVPEAISGTKDETKEVKNVVKKADGTMIHENVTEAEWTQGKTDGIYENDTTWSAEATVPQYQGIDQSKLVPLLVKTIQELEARITALESE